MSFFLLFAVLVMVVGIITGVTFLQRSFPRNGRLDGVGSSNAVTEEVERLRLEVGDLQSELRSLNERLDFTEQLLLKPGEEDEASTDTPGG